MNIIVTGTGSVNGLGHIVAEMLASDGHNVLGWTLNPKEKKMYREVHVDVTDPQYVQTGTNIANEYFETQIDVVINNAGVNKLDYIEDVTLADMSYVFGTNVWGPLCVVQHLLPALQESKGTVLNIGSSAAHCPMTASYVYNCSKAAIDMGTRQMARELGRRYGICVFGINPNKLSGTDMSRSVEEQVMRVRGWTREYARDYQEKSLPAGMETDPFQLAQFITFLLQKKEHHIHLQGCVLEYGVQS